MTICIMMDEYKNEIFDQIISEVRRRLFDESMPRIKKCLDNLSEKDIWWKPNDNSNSVGNLILHLCGNIRQWMLSGLGGSVDDRVRQKEFDEKGPLPKEDLIQNIEQVMREVDKLLDRLQPQTLIEKKVVQGFEETGISILVHVIEHFSYHVGQIVYITKAAKDIDLRFYGNKDLNVTGKGS